MRTGAGAPAPDDDGVHGGELACAAEWALSGDHLVQHHAEGKQVRARTGLIPHGLLGGHISRRADSGSIPRQFRSRGFRQSEIRDARQSLGREHHVFRLDIAMNDALADGRVPGPGPSRSRSARLRATETPGRCAVCFDALAKCSTGQIFEHQKAAGFLRSLLFHGMDRRDMWMIEG